MTTAPRSPAMPTPRPVPAALLWRGADPGTDSALHPEGHLDPAGPIAQNRGHGAAIRDALPVHLAAGTRPLNDPLSLTICCAAQAHPAVEAVLSPFAETLQVTLQDATTAKQIKTALPGSGNAPGLIFFEGLAEALAKGLSAPDSTAEVANLVKEWRDRSTALFDSLRGSRQQITLIAAEALWTDPLAVQKALAARFGLPLAAKPAVPQVPAGVAPAPHFVLMANTLALTDPQVRAVFDQLTTESLMAGDIKLRHTQTLEALQQQLTQVGRQDQQAAHDRDLRRVETLAENTIQRMRHQTDVARQRLLETEALSSRLSEDAAQSMAAATYLKEELTRREAIYAAQTSEIEMLRKTLQQTEASRKASSLRSHRLEEEIATLTRNVAMRDDRLRGLAASLVGYEDEALALRDEVLPLRDEIAALRRSTSWRITAPLRGVILLLRKVLRR